MCGPCVRIDIPEAHDPHVDALMRPIPLEEGTLRCRVRRFEGHRLDLYIESGNVFALSAFRDGRDWLIMDHQPPSDQKRPARYIARLRSHKDATFTCVRSRYEKSSAPNELLHVRHSVTHENRDQPGLNIVCVALPILSPDGENIDVPPGELAKQTYLALDGKRQATKGYTVFVSRLPKWNSRSMTYELPFLGRANFSSARNFQLIEQAAEQSDRVVLLYGKMEANEFALDFAHPLSLLHAFAICMTTFAW